MFETSIYSHFSLCLYFKKKENLWQKNQHLICKIGLHFGWNWTILSNFYPLEVEGCGGEIQLQVGKLLFIM